MSLGLIDDKTEVAPTPVSFDIGNPSIIIKGSFDAFNEAPPLILISEPDPGAPLVFMDTPAILPFNKFSAVTTLPLLKFFESNVATDPVASSFLVVP